MTEDEAARKLGKMLMESDAVRELIAETVTKEREAILAGLEDHKQDAVSRLLHERASAFRDAVDFIRARGTSC